MAYSNAAKRKLVTKAADWLENGRNNWCRGSYMKFKGESDIGWRTGLRAKKEVKACCGVGALLVHLPKKAIKEEPSWGYPLDITTEINNDFLELHKSHIIDYNDRWAKNKKQVISAFRKLADSYLSKKKAA